MASLLTVARGGALPAFTRGIAGFLGLGPETTVLIWS